MLDSQRYRPSPDYDSGIAFAPPTQELIAEAGRRLADGAPGSEVILFGSHARAEAGPNSDVDFLVIVPETDNEARESARLRRLLRELPFAMDIIVVTRAYAEKWRHAYGDAVAYEGFSFAPGAGVPRENEYVARRGPAGWQSTQLTPTDHGTYKALDTALTEAVLQGDGSLSPQAPPDYSNVYAQSVADPLSFQPLLASEPPHRPANQFQLRFAAAAADLSRVFFSANDALTAATAVAPAPEDGGQGKSNLYEWERASGALRLVNVFPDNTETEAGAEFGTGGSANTVSADGSRAFFSDGAGQLYVREDAALTRAIAGSGPGAGFLSASTDGSKVLLANGHLYDLVADETVDLAEGKGGFLGLVGQSNDLSHIYFVDTAVLSEDENSEGDKAVAGKPNLYAWVEGTMAFVAPLVAGDNSGGSNELSRDWVAFPSARTAEASPAGRFVAFLSQAQLTGYDNTGPCESDHLDGLVDAPCPQAYLYDSATGELDCASCNPSGARPLGSSVLRLIAGGAAATLPQPRYLTDSGRLYFDSQDSLSPFDTNEGVEDVYEFEPEGIGGCTREGGCVALISGGAKKSTRTSWRLMRAARTSSSPAVTDCFPPTRTN